MTSISPGMDIPPRNVSMVGFIFKVSLELLPDLPPSGNMKSKFTVNLIAKNPDTQGGSKESSSLIKSLDWRLLIDNKEVLDGEVNNITVPGASGKICRRNYKSCNQTC